MHFLVHAVRALCRPAVAKEAGRSEVVTAQESSSEVAVVQQLAGKRVQRTYKGFDKVRL